MPFLQKNKNILAAFCVSGFLLFLGIVLLFAFASGVEYFRNRESQNLGKLKFSEGYHLSDQLLGWRLKPNIQIVDRAGLRLFHTNRFGFRNPGKELPPKAKVMLFGDSFVQGYFLNEEETISAKLKKNLNAEVFNFGVGGYSTDQEFILAREALNRFESEWVVLFLYSNDLPYLTRSKAWRKEKPRFLMENGSFLFDKLKTASFVEYSGPIFPEGDGLDKFKSSERVIDIEPRATALKELQAAFRSRFLRVAAFLDNPKLLWQAMGRGILLGEIGNELRLEIEPQLGRDAYRKENFLEAYWDLSFQFFAELKRLSAQKGSRFVVFFIPEYAQIERGERYFEPQRSFVRWCEKSQIECLEPHLEFVKEGLKRPLYFKNDGHFNAAGAELAALLVSEYIRSQSGAKIGKLGAHRVDIK